MSDNEFILFASHDMPIALVKGCFEYLSDKLKDRKGKVFFVPDACLKVFHSAGLINLVGSTNYGYSLNFIIQSTELLRHTRGYGNGGYYHVMDKLTEAFQLSESLSQTKLTEEVVKQISF